MPAATQAPPAAVPAAAPKAPKAGPTAIPVGAMPTPPTSAPNEPAATIDPLSGFDRYAKPAEEGLVPHSPKPQPQQKQPEQPKAEEPEQDKEEPKPETAPEDDDDSLGDDTKATPKPEPKEEAPVEGKGKKVSPWKLVEEHKSARLKAETEVAELRKLIPNEAEAKSSQERFKSLEAQNKELLEHLRHLDYQKHPEFLDKYEKPYNDKWNSIMRRLNGVKLKDAEGNARDVQPSDIVRLGTLTADQVIEQAESQFGKLGNWVAERVEELKTLQESKFAALDNAKKDAAKLAEQWESQNNEINKFLKDTYTKSLTEIEQHSKYGQYFKMKEGDDEFNSKLEGGTKFVDENWQKDPRDPSLTQEQRAKIVKSHAAIRNRARAFSVLNLTVQRQEAEIARLNSELAQFKSSEPKIEGQRQEQPSNGASSNPMDSIFQGIEKYARPGVV